MSTKGSMFGWILIFCLVTVTAGLVRAQTRTGFLYTNNSPTGSNNVSRFEAFDDCTLGLLGQTNTGGAGAGGGFFASSRLVAQGSCLFASNDGNNTISAFQVDPATGDLTPAGAPVAPGAVAGNGTALGVSPDGAFLYASYGGSNNIARLAIAEDCSLTAQPPLTPLPPNSLPLDLAISPDGNCLVTTLGNLPNQVVSFVRDPAAGGLTPVAGSPFMALGPGSPASLQFSADGTRLYSGKSILNAVAAHIFDVDPSTCVLNPRPAVVIGGNNSNVARLNPAEDCLLVTSQNSNGIVSFAVDAGGDLSLAGFTLGFPERAFISGIQLDPAGSCAYATYFQPSSVASFSVDACTATPVSVTSTGAPPGLLQGMAFVPTSTQ